MGRIGVWRGQGWSELELDWSFEGSRMVRIGVLRNGDDKTTRFLTLRAPKSSQNIRIYDVFATPKKAHVAKTPLFATLWQDHMSEMLYFTVFLNHLLKNTGMYSVLRKHMHKRP